MSLTIRNFNSRLWNEVYDKVIGAAVFIDDASAECLHWSGTVLDLMSKGAVEVQSLIPTAFALPEHKKAVFICQATSTQWRTIKSIINQSAFSHCMLITTVSLDVLFLELNEGKDVSSVINAGKSEIEATKLLEYMLNGWMDRFPKAVEVVHIPLCSIEVTKNIFLTPPHAEVFPIINNSLLIDELSLDLYSINIKERSQVRRLASSLNNIMEALNLKEDVYYMGPYSSLVAGVLDNSPVSLTRRKNGTTAASLILVDATLDMCGLTSHNFESMLDKFMAVMPRFPGHSTDVAIDMSLVSTASPHNTSFDGVQLSPGYLYHNNKDCQEIISDMIHKTQKDVMNHLYEKLSQVDVMKSPAVKSPLTRVTPQTLEKMILKSKGNSKVLADNLGVIQQGVGVVRALRCKRAVQVDLAQRLQLQAVQNLITSRDSTSVLLQMTNLIKTRQERNLPLIRLLTILVHIYSLAGTEISFSSDHEDMLVDVVTTAVLDDHRGVEYYIGPTEVNTDHQCRKVANEILNRLKEIAKVRRNLTNYKSLLKTTEPGCGWEYHGLLQQLVDDLVDPRRPNIPDLKQRKQGLQDLFRTGLNLLTNKVPLPEKHPLDNPTVIIFVVGGATSEQCARIHRLVNTSGLDNTFLVGSTRLANAVDVTRDALNL